MKFRTVVLVLALCLIAAAQVAARQSSGEPFDR